MKVEDIQFTVGVNGNTIYIGKDHQVTVNDAQFLLFRTLYDEVKSLKKQDVTNMKAQAETPVKRTYKRKPK